MIVIVLIQYCNDIINLGSIFLVSQSVSQTFWHCHNGEILTVSKTLWHILWHQKYGSKVWVYVLSATVPTALRQPWCNSEWRKVTLKMFFLLFCHFVLGHLGIWKDVHKGKQIKIKRWKTLHSRTHIQARRVWIIDHCEKIFTTINVFKHSDHKVSFCDIIHIWDPPLNCLPR